MLSLRHLPGRPSSHAPNIHDGRAGRPPVQPVCWLGPPAPPQLYARCGSSCAWAILPDSLHMSAGAHVSHVGQVSFSWSLVPLPGFDYAGAPANATGRGVTGKGLPVIT